jgi:hypothetical protein
MPTTRLSAEELNMAATVGVRRRIESIGRYQDTTDRIGRTGWEDDIQGAIAEYACSKYLRLPWTGVTAHRDDLPGIDVKSTRVPDSPLRLIDGYKHIFVHAYVNHDEVTLHGWARVEDALIANAPFFTDRKKRRVYEMPIIELLPMTDLRDWSAKQHRHD